MTTSLLQVLQLVLIQVTNITNKVNIEFWVG